MFRLKLARNDPTNLLDTKQIQRFYHRDILSVFVNQRFYDSPATTQDVYGKIFTMQIKRVCLGNAEITWHHE